jgi:DNA-directed RNA polymerase specialized sigma24 family protein
MGGLARKHGVSAFGDSGVTPARLTSEDYQKFRPLMMTAFSHLAHQGYAAPPADGLELVHDFFIEAWDGLVDRYDESHAKFETYLFAAFVRFARPRIVKNLRWTRELFPPDEIEKTHDALLDMHAVGQEHALDVRVMESALSSLASSDRELLATRFAEGLSEKDASRRLGMSRYYFREACVGALTRLAARLNEPGPIGARDWQIASALWVEGRTVPDIAESFEISPSRVKAVRERLLRLIARNVSRAVHSSLSRSEIGIMANTKTDNCILWERLLKNPQDQQTIASIRKSPKRLAQFLDHLEGECLACEELSQNAENPESIYAALGALEDEFTSEDREILGRALDARAQDERQLGEAVLTALLPSLHRNLHQVVPWLATQVLPKVPESWPDVLALSANLPESDRMLFDNLPVDSSRVRKNSTTTRFGASIA